MDHMTFAAHETAQLHPSAWERWVKAVEQQLGHDLDGDDTAQARAAGRSDGYSLDGAYEAFGSDASVDEFVRFTDQQKLKAAANLLPAVADHAALKQLRAEFLAFRNALSCSGGQSQ